MSNLIGANLQVRIPLSTLKKMGTIPGTGKFQTFLENLYNKFEKEFRKTLSTSEAEMMPYMANSWLIPTILQEMIEKNVTFEQAFSANSSKLGLELYELSQKIDMIETDEVVSQKLIDGMISIISEKWTNKISTSEESNNSLLATNIPELSHITTSSMRKLGILEIAKTVSRKSKVYRAIDKKFLIPIEKYVETGMQKQFQKLLNIFDDNDDFESIDGFDEISEIKEKLIEKFENDADLIPIQAVLSVLLTKAIDENLTLQQAILSFDTKVLIENAIEHCVLYITNIENYIVIVDSALDSMCSVLQEIVSSDDEF